jgi:hypothetical protein
MPALADNDVVVHGNAGRGGEIDDRIWISACNGEGSYFRDKTLRMNDASGATLDIIELLALLTPTQLRLGGWLILTSKGPPI